MWIGLEIESSKLLIFRRNRAGAQTDRRGITALNGKNNNETYIYTKVNKTTYGRTSNSDTKTRNDKILFESVRLERVS